MAERQTHETVAYSGEMKDVLREVLQDNLSPEAVAAIAGLLGPDADAVEKPVGDEVVWFRTFLIEVLGGHDAWWQVWANLTIQDSNRSS